MVSDYVMPTAQAQIVLIMADGVFCYCLKNLFVVRFLNGCISTCTSGRAIRHQGDYATILLLDRRYTKAGTVAKLPGWISQHLQKMEKFGTALGAVSKV